jgi:hypothetical protein
VQVSQEFQAAKYIINSREIDQKRDENERLQSQQKA